MWKRLQSRADKGTPNVLCTVCQWKILPGSQAQVPASVPLFFSFCENVFLSREWRCISAQKEKHVCYCTKTNRINLTSRGNGAETSLTTAAGPSDDCTLPNQAAFWKPCHFIPGKKKKKKEGESRVSGGICNNRKNKGEEDFLSLIFFFCSSRSSGVVQENKMQQIMDLMHCC